MLAKIAELPEPDRALAERLHALITASAPALTPRTWYGMPAYAKDGDVVCFFQSAQKFKSRYATLGFSDKANLDDGEMWPTSFALKALTAAEEARIAGARAAGGELRTELLGRVAATVGGRMSRGREEGNAPAADDAAEHLRLLVESQPDYAIFLLDPSGHVRDLERWRPPVEGLCGGRDHRTPFLGVLSARAGRRGPAGADPGVGAPDGRHETEGWRVRKDGTRFWANVVITALHDERGVLVGFGKVTRDLTSRQLATEQLRTAAAELRVANAELEQFRLLVMSVRDYAIFLLDVSGRIRTWNLGAENIKGYTADEVIGRHFELFYTEPARARKHPAYELEVAIREGRFEEEGWRVRKDGTLFWANVVITALRDARGGLVGFAKVTRDLTERRHAQQRLEDSERRAREEAKHQRRRSAALERVSRAITAQLDLEEILQTAIDAATDLTGADRGVFDRGLTARASCAATTSAEIRGWPRGRPPGARGRCAATSRCRSGWPTARSRAAWSSGTRTRACSTPRPRRRR